MFFICLFIVCCFHLYLYCSFKKDEKQNNNTKDCQKYKNIPSDKYIDYAVNSICDDRITSKTLDLIQIPFIVFSPFPDKERRLKRAINKVKDFWELKENPKYYLNQAYYYYTIYYGSDHLCWYKNNHLPVSLVPDELLGLDFDDYLEKQFNIVFNKKEEFKNNISKILVSTDNNSSNQKKSQIKNKQVKVLKEDKINKVKKKRYRRKRKKHFLKSFINCFVTSIKKVSSLFYLKIKHIYNSSKDYKNMLCIKAFSFKEKILSKKQISQQKQKHDIYNKDYIKHFFNSLYVCFCGLLVQIYNNINNLFENFIDLFVAEKIFLKYQVCLN